MKALLWKKIKELYTNKIRVVVALILPIVMLGFMVYQGYSFATIIFLFPLINIILNWIILFSIEDIIFAEVILGTTITIKCIWLFNVLLEVVLGFAYSTVLITIAYISKFNNVSISGNDVIDIFCAIITGAGLIIFATFYVSDYSKIKNLISSIGAILNLAIVAVVFATPKQAGIIMENRFVLLAVSVTLGLVSYLIVNKYSSAEKFVNNIKNMGQKYDNKQSLDE